jgi:hypothetical protein
MELFSIALATLIIVVLSHIAVYWVVRTLYPPIPIPVPVPSPSPAPIPQPIFTSPPQEEQQDVILPTYETAISSPPPREEGKANPIADIRGDPIQRNTRMDTPNA